MSISKKLNLVFRILFTTFVAFCLTKLFVNSYADTE
jgi:hypothetical protein